MMTAKCRPEPPARVAYSGTPRQSHSVGLGMNCRNQVVSADADSAMSPIGHCVWAGTAERPYRSAPRRLWRPTIAECAWTVQLAPWLWVRRRLPIFEVSDDGTVQTMRLGGPRTAFYREPASDLPDASVPPKTPLMAMPSGPFQIATSSLDRAGRCR